VRPDLFNKSVVIDFESDLKLLMPGMYDLCAVSELCDADYQ